MNRFFLFKPGIKTGAGPLFIVTNARTVRIGGLNDRSMFVRYVFELLARINTNIKRNKIPSRIHHHRSQKRKTTRKRKPRENKVTQELKGRDDKVPM